MHHHLANQEIARLRYADAIRNATRHVDVEPVELPAQRSPQPQLVARLRGVIGNVFAHAPTSRPVAQ